MASPFPGMDPYLEEPAVWSGFHVTLLAAMQENLAPVLRPNYFVRLEERVYVTTEDDPGRRVIVPDVRIIEPFLDRPKITRPKSRGIAEPIPVAELLDPEIHEHRLEIVDRVRREVVTVIELLSPTNKVSGSMGRQSFLKKRAQVYASDAHWIEMDLLREGTRTANLAATTDVEYQVFLSRSGTPRRGFAWPITIRQPLPVIGIPLRAGDPDVPLDLQQIFDQVYVRNGYDLDFDHNEPPVPPLSAELTIWARETLKTARE